MVAFFIFYFVSSGSTDVVSCSVHGVRDPVTAALHIILGNCECVLSNSLHELTPGLVSVILLEFLSCGFTGQSAFKTETLRDKTEA